MRDSCPLLIATWGCALSYIQTCMQMQYYTPICTHAYTVKPYLSACFGSQWFWLDYQSMQISESRKNVVKLFTVCQDCSHKKMQFTEEMDY